MRFKRKNRQYLCGPICQRDVWNRSEKSDNEMFAVIIDNQKDALLFADTLHNASQSLKLEIKQEEIIEF
ncbi:hypothetical protein [Laceyella putida]|uniref:Uncharacterized protein n=1 Tax=Laceyella putida TaxID=110101 RepID=A0ABW2RHB4_9BACL